MNRQRLLIVEDDLLTGKYLATIVDKVFRADLIHTVEDGLIAHKGDPADLILLDLMLPNGHGLEVIRKFRALDNRTPIIVITGMTKEDVRTEDAIVAGAQDIIRKSDISPRALASAIIRALARVASQTDMKPTEQQMTRLRDTANSLAESMGTKSGEMRRGDTDVQIPKVKEGQ